MKEIWTLIELLNEYEREKIIHRTYYLVSWYIMYKRDDGEEVDDKRTDLEIISKSYGFIKWLVKNDKIDWLKFYGENEYTPIWVNAKSDIDQVYSVEEQILMILSISDTPIEDLLLYLK